MHSNKYKSRKAFQRVGENMALVSPSPIIKKVKAIDNNDAN